MLEHNQQSHVTTNYQLINVYTNVIERIVCCILKWHLFILTVKVRDKGAVVFVEYLVTWMTRDIQFIIKLASFWYVWRSTKDIFYTHVASVCSLFSIGRTSLLTDRTRFIFIIWLICVPFDESYRCCTMGRHRALEKLVSKFMGWHLHVVFFQNGVCNCSCCIENECKAFQWTSFRLYSCWTIARNKIYNINTAFCVVI